MIETLPKGVTIGTMQAPLSWIFSHTSRFIGIVRITIQEGKGVILIEKGTPRFFYFGHGNRVLKGNAAREYFNAQPLLDFSLDRLTPEEFALAFSRAEPETAAAGEPAAPAPVMPPVPEQPPAAAGDRPRVVVVPRPKAAEAPAAAPPAGPPLERPVSIPPTWEPAGRKVRAPGGGESPEKAPAPVKADGPGPQGEPFDIFEDSMADTVLTEERLKGAAPAGGVPAPPAPPQAVPRPAEPAAAQAGAGGASEEPITDEDFRIIAQVLLGRIKTIPGVIAVMVFNKDMHLLSIGDVNLDRLVSSAEDMLMTVSQLDSIMQWGSFVSMTLQVPSGNVIIAPFFDEYLCILTSPEINLGRIRRILREIKSQQNR